MDRSEVPAIGQRWVIALAFALGVVFLFIFRFGSEPRSVRPVTGDVAPSKPESASVVAPIAAQDTRLAAQTGEIPAPGELLSPPTPGVLWVRTEGVDGTPLPFVGVRVFDRHDAKGRTGLSLQDPGRIKLSQRASGGTDASGIGQVDVGDLRTGIVYAEVSGFAPEAVWPPTGSFSAYCNPSNPLLVRLGPAVSLTVIASDAGRPVSNFSATLVPFFEPRTSFPEPYLLPIKWRAVTDITGMARFDDLPTNVRIDVRGEYQKIPKLIKESPLRLSAGEQRVLRVDVRAPITVRGRLITPSGVSPGTVNLWMRPDLRSTSIPSNDERYFTALDLPLDRKSIMTNAEGEFQFQAADGARLWIGPWAMRTSPQPQVWSPVARSLIARAEAPVIELQTYPSGILRGLVTNQLGEAQRNATVVAESSDQHGVATTRADHKGAFVFNTLPRGLHRIYSQATDLQLPSTIESVDLGAEEAFVLLTVPDGSLVELNTVDGDTNLPCSGEVAISGTSLPYQLTAMTNAEGQCRITVPSGSFDIVVRDANGKIGIERGVVLEGGSSPIQKTIRTGMGATAWIEYVGREEIGHVELMSDGVFLTRKPLFQGQTVKVSVPAGRVTAKFYVLGSLSDVVDVSVELGKEVLVELGRP